MGCRSSRQKINKDGEKQKVFKVGLSFGRNDLKVEGNFQAGYHSKVKRKYVTVDGICKPVCILPQEEEEARLPQIQHQENEPLTNEENKPPINEDEKENERLLSESILQS